MSAFGILQKSIISLIQWGTIETQKDIENRSIKFSNVIFLVLAGISLYAFISNINLFVSPEDLVWDQWSIPFMIFYSLASLYLNKRSYTLLSRIIFLILWPSVSYIIPIIIQHTPSDYYLGYPIALIFHGFLVQVTIPRKVYSALFWILISLNFVLVITFPDFLLFFDDEAGQLSSMTDNRYYFINGLLFWISMNLILAYLLNSLNGRIDEVELQKSMLEKQKDQLEKTVEKLNKRQEQLIHSEKMASLVTLSSGLAHEINNPLNFVKGAYDLLEKQKDDNGSIDAEAWDTSVSLLSQGIDRIGSIVRNLGVFSFVEGGVSEPCKIYEIVETCKIALKSKLGNKSIINNTEKSLVINGNPFILYQIVFQTLDNAVDAVGDEGEISIDFTTQDDKVEYIIQDNGPGINHDDLKRITDPFYTTKEPGKGTGLGLFITESIVNDMNGKIDVNSEKGVGTSIKITFPVI